jgi:hypothetical protein
MLAWFKQLDELLRGRRTVPEDLAEGRIELPLRTFVPLAVLLGAVYGFFMGWYGIFSRDPACYVQVVASVVKLPALFLLTLVVTYPSLYVFNALVGCGLSFSATLRLLVGAIVVNVAVAASFGPILAFFTVSTTSYPFMILLNVLLLGVAGVVSLAFLLHSLRRLAAGTSPTSPLVTPANASNDNGDNDTTDKDQAPSPPRPGPLDQVSGAASDHALAKARGIFQIWVVIYGLVGAQMGWLLRPFIGSPDLTFTWFRHREGNFFLAVYMQLQNLLAGG